MKKIIRRLFKRATSPVLREFTLAATNEAVAQKTLVMQYRGLAAQQRLPQLADVGFRRYSQFEEDGILLYIFSLIPAINRTSVEICAGDGRQCNTTNLIINHGWWGHLFDGDEGNVRVGQAFFREHPDTFRYPPRFNHAWVTAENVNDLIAGSGASGPIDLLSIDIDGMDYWVWKAISVVEPQVVVCEVHNPIPPDKALTVPYDPAFTYESDNYRGASLAAMTKLGREKGYRLIGTHRFGFNAFFMKDGVGEKFFPEVDVGSCQQDPFSQEARASRWSLAAHEDWVEV